MDPSKKIFLAPIASVTDFVFRKICEDFGADVVCTELISSNGIVRNSKKTMEFINIKEHKAIKGIQIFGNDKYIMCDAIQLLYKFKPDYIDINLGCSVKKINKSGYGSILLKDIKKLTALISSITKCSKLPISAKIRLGWDYDNSINIAKALEYNGVSFISVHGRIAKQKFEGKANWDAIKKIKENVNIPIIGNGDIFNPQDAIHKWKYSNVDGIMIARGAMGNPWIFKQIKELLYYNKIITMPSVEDIKNMLIKHYKDNFKYYGNYKIKYMRKHFIWYTKGIKNIKSIRKKVFELEDFESIKELLKEVI